MSKMNDIEKEIIFISARRIIQSKLMHDDARELYKVENNKTEL